jgi:hypothetical protein
MYAYFCIFYFSLPQNVDKSVKPQIESLLPKNGHQKWLSTFSDICAKETGCVITTLKCFGKKSKQKQFQFQFSVKRPKWEEKI